MRHERDTINRQQLLALCFTVLLSPAIRLTPKSVVEIAGRAGWLSCILAFLPLSLLAVFIVRMQKSLSPGEGMGHIFVRALGKYMGRFALFVYALWLLFYAGFLLLSGANRFISTVYPNSGPWVFVGFMLLLTVIAALGRCRVLGRSAQVFCPPLIAALAIVFIFALPDVRAENLLPISTADAVPVLIGMIPVVNVVSILAYLSFLSCYNEPDALSARAFILRQTLIILVCTLLCVTTTGIFGAELVTRITFPFFVMIRDITIFNVLERIEALVIALWVFTDFLLVTVLFRAAEVNLRMAAGKPPRRPETELPRMERRPILFSQGRWLVWLCALAALAAAIFFSPSAFTLQRWSERLIPAMNLGFVLVGFPLVYIVGKLRRKI